MKTVFEHIEHAKRKPHHIRKRIVFATAGLGMALVGLVWVVGNLSFGTFVIQGSNFADAGVNGNGSTSENVGSGRPAAGVAGAAAAISDTDVPAHIEIVDTSPKTPSGKPVEQTTIPF